jgi:metal-responsive CopG/Arc/MetJ family transcriptional regulator
MGRKKVPASMKKDQVSVSLPRHMIERLDIITSRRSLFIQSAIKSKIESTEGLESISNRRLIAVLLGRYRGDVQKEVILKSWFDEE